MLHLTDGDTVAVDNALSVLLRIGGDWYYASCGETFGYQPIYHMLYKFEYGSRLVDGK